MLWDKNVRVSEYITALLEFTLKYFLGHVVNISTKSKRIRVLHKYEIFEKTAIE
jgi:hypothetical protein